MRPARLLRPLGGRKGNNHGIGVDSRIWFEVFVLVGAAGGRRLSFFERQDRIFREDLATSV
jgi:hypothetical protein